MRPREADRQRRQREQRERRRAGGGAGRGCGRRGSAPAPASRTPPPAGAGAARAGRSRRPRAARPAAPAAPAATGSSPSASAAAQVQRERAQPVALGREHDVADAERRELAARPPAAPRPRPPRSARAASRSRVSTRSWRPVSGSTSQSSPTFGSCLLARVADLDREHVVAAGELEQRRAPVARAAEVGDDDDERALPRQPRRRSPSAAPSDVAPPPSSTGSCRSASSSPSSPARPWPRRDRPRLLVAEGDEAEPVAAPAWRGGRARARPLGDVGLSPLGGAERHRRRDVEHEPGHEHALGEVDADVRLAGPRGHVPLDPADVVAGLVGTHLRELAARAEHATSGGRRRAAPRSAARSSGRARGAASPAAAPAPAGRASGRCASGATLKPPTRSAPSSSCGRRHRRRARASRIVSASTCSASAW